MFSKHQYFLNFLVQRIDGFSAYSSERLAAGDADALSGRYITVEDDLDALVKQFGASAPGDQRLLRVNGTTALSVG